MSKPSAGRSDFMLEVALKFKKKKKKKKLFARLPNVHSQVNCKQLCAHPNNNALFAYNLLTTEYHRQVSDAVTTLATSDIPCMRDAASTVAFLQWQLGIIMLYGLKSDRS